jgi:hypothetical protein
MTSTSDETPRHDHTNHTHILSPSPFGNNHASRSSNAYNNNDIPPDILRRLQTGSLSFPVNDECTSLALTPSGQFVLGGFSDGTLRVFDVTHRFPQQQQQKPLTVNQIPPAAHHEASSSMPSSHSSSQFVSSHDHQQFGAVTCQIHARGVHTSLKMHVSISPDGMFAFAGVTRGSMELVAVHLGYLEQAAASVVDGVSKTAITTATTTLQTPAPPPSSSQQAHNAPRNLLDYVTVYRHSHAKLRGFGACTKLSHSDKYLLLCGKGIKNIHVWSFQPPTLPNQEPSFELVYNCVTNGNSIHLLSFRHVAPGHLLALSKSQQQKLRVWDLSQEDTPDALSSSSSSSTLEEKRPSRPPFVDIANSEATIGVAGNMCLCGGSEYHHFNQMSIVSLEDVTSTFNQMELALPGVATQSFFNNRRQQRGDLKNVEAVAGMTSDGGHALLELNDKTLVQYTHADSAGDASVSSCLPLLRAVQHSELPEGWSRVMAVGRMGGHGLAVAAVAVHNPAASKGSIRLWSMESVETANARPLRANIVPMGALTVPMPDSMTRPRAPTAMSVAATYKNAPNSQDEQTTAGIPKMRDLTNDSSTSKASRKPTSSLRNPDRVSTSYNKTPAGQLALLATAKKITPELLERLQSGHSNRVAIQSESEATRELLEAAEGLRKVKFSGTKRRTDTSSSSSVKGVSEESGSKQVKSRKVIASSRRISDHESLWRDRLEAVKGIQYTGSDDQTPLVPRKPSFVLKPNSEPFSKTVRASGGNISPFPLPKLTITDSTSMSPMRSPKPPNARQNRKEELLESVREKCEEQQDKIKQRLAEFPSTSVCDRMGLRNETTSSVEEAHDRQRRMLLAEHRAAHERVAKTVLRASHDILQSVQHFPSLQSLDSARELLRITLNNFRAGLVSTRECVGQGLEVVMICTVFQLTFAFAGQATSIPAFAGARAGSQTDLGMSGRERSKYSRFVPVLLCL